MAGLNVFFNRGRERASALLPSVAEHAPIVHEFALKQWHTSEILRCPLAAEFFWNSARIEVFWGIGLSHPPYNVRVYPYLPQESERG